LGPGGLLRRPLLTFSLSGASFSLWRGIALQLWLTGDIASLDIAIKLLDDGSSVIGDPGFISCQNPIPVILININDIACVIGSDDREIFGLALINLSCPVDGALGNGGRSRREITGKGVWDAY